MKENSNPMEWIRRGVLGLVALAGGQASGQCTAPVIHLSYNIDQPPQFRSINSVGNPDILPYNAVTGTRPFSFFWEYDTTGNGDWIPFPSSGRIYFGGREVGLGQGGASYGIDGHMQFAVGLYLRIPTRLTVSNECGSDTTNMRLWYCHADIDGEGGLDISDYLTFVGAFSSNESRGDFNRDSSIDLFDYLDYVEAFAAGCPD